MRGASDSGVPSSLALTHLIRLQSAAWERARAIRLESSDPAKAHSNVMGRLKGLLGQKSGTLLM